MGWFIKLCRNTGLMVHYIKNAEFEQSTVVGKEVNEKKLDLKTTLRRTTIDEIEVKQNGQSDTSD